MKKSSQTTQKIVFWNKKTGSKFFLKGKRKVLVGGCFDVFHYGHLTFLRKAKEQGDFLIVLLESDEFIRKNKRYSPVHNQRQRAELLASIEWVDLVVLLPLLTSDTQYFKVVGTVNPAIIAVTKGDPYINQKASQAKRIGSELKIVCPLLRTFSSSKIIDYVTISRD